MALLIDIGICSLAFRSYLRPCGVRAIPFQPCCTNPIDGMADEFPVSCLRLAYQPVPTRVAFYAHALLASLQFTILSRSCWIPFLFPGKLAEQHHMAVSQALISFVLSMPILIRIFLCPLQSQHCSHMFKELSKVITKQIPRWPTCLLPHHYARIGHVIPL